MVKPFPPPTMRAWQFSSTSGGIEKNLAVNPSAPLPKPKPDQHLVQILATALNPVDYKLAETPLVSRLLIRKPAMPGLDIACCLVTPAAGSPLKPGQLLVGVASANPMAGGSLAEFNVAPANTMIALPGGVDPLDGATLGIAGMTAYQSIVPRVKKGDSIFINGGSGGVGAFGIQFAKIAGCHVTTSCSTRNIEFCKSLGADEVVDYTKGNVATALKEGGRMFDHVVDNVGTNQELVWRCYEFMNPGAVYIKVAGDASLTSLFNSFKNQYWPASLGGMQRNLEGFWPKPDLDDLSQICEWVKEGRVKTVIDQRFSFEDVPKAFEKLKTGRARGKIVVDVALETYKEAWGES